MKKISKKKIISVMDYSFAQFISNNNAICMLVAACVSFEKKNGHIFLPIEYFEKKYFFSILKKEYTKKILECLNKKKINWSLELLQCSSCSDGSSITPLVIFKKKIYLYKMWKAEKVFLEFLSRKNQLKETNIEKKHKILNNLFPRKKDYLQKTAVALTLIHNIIFITGGAGTGKTTIILKIIIALIKSSTKKIKIQLSAPTGKATARLIEMLNTTWFYNSFTEKEKKQLFFDPITLHQLLGISKISEKIFFNKNNNINVDVLIIDESSMIDILMINNILSALNKKTKIIFIGDYKQLKPIQSSSILKYIINYAKDGYSFETKLILKKIMQNDIFLDKKINKKNTSYISDKICVLEKNYRFEKKTGIYILSNAIYNNSEKVFDKLFKNLIKNVFFYEVNSLTQYKNMINTIIYSNKIYWDQIQKKENIETILKFLKHHQVLCLVRNSYFGVNFINKILEDEMYKKNIINKYFYINNQLWYIGKPILITENNKYLGISNGDMGITNFDEKNILQVSFLRKNNIIKNIPVNILSNYETSWSITVHKAQGSEFDNISLVLPNKDLKILQKDILYTAITRARKTIKIFSIKDILMKSLKI
ncbi:exodeoxyribonuclease V subunit alpha [Buchnera aphidicola]|uniref:exodeoxyribonuclease V subunit alpha n=1 Tax=Buchnera aphidicola TaxID=9 RepID=UPI0034647D08